MDLTPRHIGILGGMGPRASLRFLEHILDHTRDVHGAKDDTDYPRISMESIALPGLTASRLEDTEGTRTILREAVQRLSSQGVAAIAMPCNTAHLFFEELNEVGAPALNMIEETARTVAKCGVQSAYVLATRTTVQEHLYEMALADQGITAVSPSSEMQLKTERLISLLEDGNIHDESHTLAQELISEAVSVGAESIILGCTELSILSPFPPSPIPVIDSSQVLAESIVSVAYGATEAVPTSIQTHLVRGV